MDWYIPHDNSFLLGCSLVFLFRSDASVPKTLVGGLAPSSGTRLASLIFPGLLGKPSPLLCTLLCFQLGDELMYPVTFLRDAGLLCWLCRFIDNDGRCPRTHACAHGVAVFRRCVFQQHGRNNCKLLSGLWMRQAAWATIAPRLVCSPVLVQCVLAALPSCQAVLGAERFCKQHQTTYLLLGQIVKFQGCFFKAS